MHAAPQGRAKQIPTAPNVRAISVEANSLSWNILHASHLFSIFYQAILTFKPRNPNKTGILRHRPRKNACHRCTANPLFCNILPVKSFVSIFCEPSSRSAPDKSKKINILSFRCREIHTGYPSSRQTQSITSAQCPVPDIVEHSKDELARMTAS